jgi:hypothetical protein
MIKNMITYMLPGNRHSATRVRGRGVNLYPAREVDNENDEQNGSENTATNIHLSLHRFVMRYWTSNRWALSGRYRTIAPSEEWNDAIKAARETANKHGHA